MTALYKLTGQMAELESMCDTDDEGLKVALQDTMSAIVGEFEVKAENIVMLARNIEGDISAIDKEIERLKELKRIKGNSVSEIKDYLRRNMEAAGKSSIKRPLFTITLAKGSERVIVDSKDDIPDDLMSVSTSIEPNKVEIAAQLKELRAHNAEVQKRIDAGDEAAAEELKPIPSWAHLERGDSSIRIK